MPGDRSVTNAGGGRAFEDPATPYLNKEQPSLRHACANTFWVLLGAAAPQWSRRVWTESVCAEAEQGAAVPGCAPVGGALQHNVELSLFWCTRRLLAQRGVVHCSPCLWAANGSCSLLLSPRLPSPAPRVKSLAVDALRWPDHSAV